jgi:hypothetical protein
VCHTNCNFLELLIFFYFLFQNIKSIYAIVAKVLINWDIVETLINESKILSEHTGLDIWRVRVIISELVFDNKSFQNPENNTLKTIIQYEEKFKKIFLKQNFKVKSISSSGTVESKGMEKCCVLLFICIVFLICCRLLRLWLGDGTAYQWTLSIL